MWLDLRLKGIEPESIRTTEKSLLMGHLAKKREQRFMEMMIVIQAIVGAAHTIAGGKSDFQALSDLVRKYADLTYPEDAHDLEDKATRIKRIMEEEFAKGPLRVQAQDYDKKRRKKRN